jgi:hypothetical protein
MDIIGISCDEYRGAVLPDRESVAESAGEWNTYLDIIGNIIT